MIDYCNIFPQVILCSLLYANGMTLKVTNHEESALAESVLLASVKFLDPNEAIAVIPTMTLIRRGKNNHFDEHDHPELFAIGGDRCLNQSSLEDFEILANLRSKFPSYLFDTMSVLDYHFGFYDELVLKKLHSSEKWPIFLASKSSYAAFSTHKSFVVFYYGSKFADSLEFLCRVLNPVSKLIVIFVAKKWRSVDASRFALAKTLGHHLLDVLILKWEEGSRHVSLETFLPYEKPSGFCGVVREFVHLDTWVYTGNGIEFQKNGSLHLRKVPPVLKCCKVVSSGSKADKPFDIYDGDELAYDGIDVRLLKHVNDVMTSSDDSCHKIGKLRVTNSARAKFYRYHPSRNYPYQNLKYCFLIPEAKFFNHWSWFTFVFRTSLWVFCVSCLGLVAAVLKAMASLNKYRDYKGVCHCVLNMWAVLLGIGTNLPACRQIRIVVLSWVLFSLCVNTVFQTYVTSYFIVQVQEHQIDSLEELEKDGYTFVYDNKLKYRSHNNKSILTFNIESAFLLAINSPKTALYTAKEFFVYNANTLCTRNELPKYHEVSSFEDSNNFLGMQFEDSPLLQSRMNKVLQKLANAGIVQKIWNDVVNPKGMEIVTSSAKPTDLGLKMCFFAAARFSHLISPPNRCKSLFSETRDYTSFPYFNIEPSKSFLFWFSLPPANGFQHQKVNCRNGHALAESVRQVSLKLFNTSEPLVVFPAVTINLETENNRSIGEALQFSYHDLNVDGKCVNSRVTLELFKFSSDGNRIGLAEFHDSQSNCEFQRWTFNEGLVLEKLYSTEKWPVFLASNNSLQALIGYTNVIGFVYRIEHISNLAYFITTVFIPLKIILILIAQKNCSTDLERALQEFPAGRFQDVMVLKWEIDSDYVLLRSFQPYEQRSGFCERNFRLVYLNTWIHGSFVKNFTLRLNKIPKVVNCCEIATWFSAREPFSFVETDSEGNRIMDGTFTRTVKILNDVMTSRRNCREIGTIFAKYGFNDLEDASSSYWYHSLTYTYFVPRAKSYHRWTWFTSVFRISVKSNQFVCFDEKQRQQLRKTNPVHRVPLGFSIGHRHWEDAPDHHCPLVATFLGRLLLLHFDGPPVVFHEFLRGPIRGTSGRHSGITRLRRLHSCVRRNWQLNYNESFSIEPERDAFLHAVNTPKTALYTTEEFFKYFAKRNCRKNELPTYHKFSSYEDSNNYFGVGLPSDRLLQYRLDVVMCRLAAGGIIQKIWNDVVNSNRMEVISKRSQKHSRFDYEPMNLFSLKSCFYILLFVHSASAVIFLLELTRTLPFYQCSWNFFRALVFKIRIRLQNFDSGCLVTNQIRIKGKWRKYVTSPFSFTNQTERLATFLAKGRTSKTKADDSLGGGKRPIKNGLEASRDLLLSLGKQNTCRLHIAQGRDLFWFSLPPANGFQQQKVNYRNGHALAESVRQVSLKFFDTSEPLVVFPAVTINLETENNRSIGESLQFSYHDLNVDDKCVNSRVTLELFKFSSDGNRSGLAEFHDAQSDCEFQPWSFNEGLVLEKLYSSERWPVFLASNNSLRAFIGYKNVIAFVYRIKHISHLAYFITSVFIPLKIILILIARKNNSTDLERALQDFPAGRYQDVMVLKWEIDSDTVSIRSFQPYEQRSGFCERNFRLVYLNTWINGSFVKKFTLRLNKIPKVVNCCEIATWFSAREPFSFVETDSEGNRIMDGTFTRTVKILNDAMTSRRNCREIGTIFAKYGFNDLEDASSSYWYHSLTYTYFVPRAKSYHRWTWFTSVFRISVWMCCFSSLGMTAKAISLFASTRNSDHSYGRLSQCIVCLWASLLGIGIGRMPQTTTVRVLLLSWVVFSFCISMVLQSYFTSFFVVQFEEHQVDTVEELASEGYTVVFDAIGKYFQLNYNESFSIEPERNAFLHSVNTPKTALYSTEEFFKYFAKWNCRKNELPTYHKFSTYEDSNNYFGVGLPSDRLLQYRLDVVMCRLAAGGIIQKIWNDVVNSNRMEVIAKRSQKHSRFDYEPMNLFSLKSCFYTLLFVHSASVVFCFTLNLMVLDLEHEVSGEIRMKDHRYDKRKSYPREEQNTNPITSRCGSHSCTEDDCPQVEYFDGDLSSVGNDIDGGGCYTKRANEKEPHTGFEDRSEPRPTMAPTCLGNETEHIHPVIDTNTTQAKSKKTLSLTMMAAMPRQQTQVVYTLGLKTEVNHDQRPTMMPKGHRNEVSVLLRRD
ncbi:hypothetical protein C0J52_27176 [Blattella germanica]|nr:hypothetical protein C0J52_27176 [Blattella germanica]